MDILNQLRATGQKASVARERLALLFDEDSFAELDAFAKTGENAGVLTGWGAVEGNTIFAFAQDIAQASGAVGRQHAEKIKKLYDLAAKTGAPVVGIYDSFGGSLSEGNDVLRAYGEMMLHINSLSGVVPQIAVVAGTCAGTAALLAAGADFMVMSAEGELFLTPPSVAKAKGNAATGAGSAQNAEKAGVAHLVAKNANEAVLQARRLVGMMPQNNLASLPLFHFTAKTGAQELLRGACEGAACTTQQLVDAVFDEGSALELMPGFAQENAYTAFATMNGFTCGVAATTGKPLCANACAKLAKLAEVCDAYQIPIVTLVDSDGFIPSAQAELCGIVRDAARLGHIYAEATTPKIAVITGKAYGAVAVALAGKGANADLVYAWPSACISALPPKTAVAILHADEISNEKDEATLVAEYAVNEAGPYKACELGLTDDVIDPANTRAVLVAALEMLSSKRVSRLPKKHGNLPL